MERGRLSGPLGLSLGRVSPSDICGCGSEAAVVRTRDNTDLLFRV